MAEQKKPSEQTGIQYKDKDGSVLYGFSQTHLEKTNKQLSQVVFGLKVLIILLVVLLVSAGILLGWVSYNDVITRIIYRY
ncbi:MAG: hypothetical protein PHG05_02860 [Candidatus Nanoarchaeia archaeon]|nr:hypothetical protein [Candidatus Nanoarchaeia archaeon]